MACIVMAYIIMAYIGMPFVRMAYIVMAFIVMAFLCMACVAMAYGARPAHHQRNERVLAHELSRPSLDGEEVRLPAELQQQPQCRFGTLDPSSDRYRTCYS